VDAPDPLAALVDEQDGAVVAHRLHHGHVAQLVVAPAVPVAVVGVVEERYVTSGRQLSAVQQTRVVGLIVHARAGARQAQARLCVGRRHEPRAVVAVGLTFDHQPAAPDEAGGCRADEPPHPAAVLPRDRSGRLRLGRRRGREDRKRRLTQPVGRARVAEDAAMGAAGQQRAGKEEDKWFHHPSIFARGY